MCYLKTTNGSPFSFSTTENATKGKELAEKYASALPFPFIEIDDFLPPETLEYCIDNFPSYATEGVQTFSRSQERRKFSYQPDSLEPGVKSLFYAFNSRPFIQVIENITGIDGLIPDAYFSGAGFHEIKQGGHLSIHADFNHHIQSNLERRVNVLIYLNRNWKGSYGGQLEFWGDGMKSCVETILPKFNKAVIFNTDQGNWHGNPSPIDHPDGVSRRSIALYYYTATWNNGKRSNTTNFQRRPKSKDRRDLRIKTQEFLREYLPPFLSRRLIYWLDQLYDVR